LTSKN